jgi:hypothetical protein
MSNAETNVLKTIIDALKPLTSEERQRTLEAALVFLGEQPDAAPSTHNLDATEDETSGVRERSEALRQPPHKSQVQQE